VKAGVGEQKSVEASQKENGRDSRVKLVGSRPGGYSCMMIEIWLNAARVERRRREEGKKKII
jgi:hypothetical protein